VNESNGRLFQGEVGGRPRGRVVQWSVCEKIPDQEGFVAGNKEEKGTLTSKGSIVEGYRNQGGRRLWGRYAPLELERTQ